MSLCFNQWMFNFAEDVLELVGSDIDDVDKDKLDEIADGYELHIKKVLEENK